MAFESKRPQARSVHSRSEPPADVYLTSNGMAGIAVFRHKNPSAIVPVLRLFVKAASVVSMRETVTSFVYVMQMELPNTSAKSTPLQKGLAIAIVVVPIVTAFATAYIGGQYALASTRTDTGARMVELAANILREPPKEQAVDVREWAMDVLDRYSGVPISPQARNALTKSIALPSAGSVTVDIKVNGQDGNVVIKPGESYRYEWHSNNATACFINTSGGHQSGSSLNGVSSPVLPSETWYPKVNLPFVIDFTCLNSTSTASDAAMVTLGKLP